MEKILEIVTAADRAQATEVVFSADNPLTARGGKKSLPMTERELTRSEIEGLTESLLTAEELKTFSEQSFVQGVRTAGDIQFRFSMNMTLEGAMGVLSWKQNQALNNSWWAFPELALGCLQKQDGLILVTGVKGAGRTSAVHSLLTGVLASNDKNVCVYADQNEYQLNSSRAHYFKSQLLQQKGYQIPRTADIVVIDSDSLELYEAALRLAETGKLVIITMSSTTAIRGIERFCDLCEGHPSQIWRRFSQVLHLAVGLRLAPAAEGMGRVGLFEMLVGNQDVRKAIQAHDLYQIDHLMKTSGDKTGMRSMNQSIFQALLKRKIEFRAGFDMSQEPEELDQLLKKVGI